MASNDSTTQITIRLPNDLHQAIRDHNEGRARQKGISSVIVDVLRRYISDYGIAVKHEQAEQARAQVRSKHDALQLAERIDQSIRRVQHATTLDDQAKVTAYEKIERVIIANRLDLMGVVLESRVRNAESLTTKKRRSAFRRLLDTVRILCDKILDVHEAQGAPLVTSLPRVPNRVTGKLERAPVTDLVRP